MTQSVWWGKGQQAVVFSFYSTSNNNIRKSTSKKKDAQPILVTPIVEEGRKAWVKVVECDLGSVVKWW
jgi:hypothetical protein